MMKKKRKHYNTVKLAKAIMVMDKINYKDALLLAFIKE